MKIAFWKKDKLGAPPDVGKEDEAESEGVEEEHESEDEPEEPEKKKSVNKKIKYRKRVEEEPEEEEYIPAPSSSGRKKESSFRINEMTQLEFDKLNVRIESLNTLIKGYSERMSLLSEQIGEVRAMNLATEKTISRLGVEAAKAVDLVKEVKPEKLRLDYQRADVKLQQLNEKFGAAKEFMDTILVEIKDIRRKIGTFIGTDALLKLNEDVKRDLIETQQMAARARMHSDKTEQLFAEVKHNFTEMQKVDAKVNNLDANYSGVLKEVEKNRINFSQIVKQDDFQDFKKTVENKFAAVSAAISQIDKMRDENERLGRIVEEILSIAQQNKIDVGEVAMAVGDDRIRRVADYENQLASILGILDNLAGQIMQLRKKAGLSTKEKEKIQISPSKKVIQKNEIKLKNMEINPEISKSLMPEKESEDKVMSSLEKQSSEELNPEEEEKKFRKLQEWSGKIFSSKEPEVEEKIAEPRQKIKKIEITEKKRKMNVREKGKKGVIDEMESKLREWEKKGYNASPLKYKLKGLTAGKIKKSSRLGEKRSSGGVGKKPLGGGGKKLSGGKSSGGKLRSKKFRKKKI